MARTVTLEEAIAATAREIRLPTYLPETVQAEPARVTLTEPPGEPEGGVAIYFEPQGIPVPGEIRNVQVLSVEGTMSLKEYKPRIAICGGFEVHVQAFDPHMGQSMVMSCWVDGEFGHGVCISWIAPGPTKDVMANECMRVVNSIING